jgi:hypothetical protein
MLTRKGARRLTAMLDEVATVVQENPTLLGIDQRIASDFAYRCDLLSDAVESTAVANFPRQASEEETDAEEEAEEGTDKTANESLSQGSLFNPAQIGEEVPGPLEQLDKDEPWMANHFTQIRFDELSGAQEGGKIGPKTFVSPVAKKAAMDALLAAKTPADIQRAVRNLHAALDTLPGLSKMQLEAQVDRLLDLEKEIAAITAEYDAVFKKLSGLEKSQKEGLEVLKKAAAQVDAKGKVIIETRQGLIQFVAKMNTSTPGLEQIMARPDEVKPGERVGDLLGKLLAQLDAEVSAKCVDIIRQTKEELTYSQQICSGLKVVAKTASMPTAVAKQAGIADVAVSIKNWLAGAADALSKRILGVVGDVSRFLQTCVERTKLVQKASNDISKSLAAASKELDRLTAPGKTASKNWLTEE